MCICALNESKDSTARYCYGWMNIYVHVLWIKMGICVVHVQKVTTHVDNTVFSQNINIILEQSLCTKTKKRNNKLENTLRTTVGLNAAPSVRMRSKSSERRSMLRISLARKDAIIGILTNNTRIHHSHGNINPSDMRRLLLSARCRNMALCIKEIHVILLFSSQLCLACHEGHKWGLLHFPAAVLSCWLAGAS